MAICFANNIWKETDWVSGDSTDMFMSYCGGRSVPPGLTSEFQKSACHWNSRNLGLVAHVSIALGMRLRRTHRHHGRWSRESDEESSRRDAEGVMASLMSRRAQLLRSKLRQVEVVSFPGFSENFLLKTRPVLKMTGSPAPQNQSWQNHYLKCITWHTGIWNTWPIKTCLYNIF